MLSFQEYFFQCYQIVNFMLYSITLSLQVHVQNIHIGRHFYDSRAISLRSDYAC